LRGESAAAEVGAIPSQHRAQRAGLRGVRAVDVEHVAWETAALARAAQDQLRDRFGTA
jgi:hypothetical protein